MTRPSDQELVDLLLSREPEDADRLHARRNQAAPGARLNAMEALLARASDAVTAGDDAPSPAKTALADRILSRTTREDLSWRGDLKLVTGYVRERMRESRLVRTLAALLLGNLTIGPVVAVAWVLTHEPEPERELFFQVESPADELIADADDAEAIQPLDDVEVDGVVEPDHLAALRIENLLKRARYQLAPQHGLVPAPRTSGAVGKGGALDAPALLDARARYLAGDGWSQALDDAARVDGGDATRLALYAELLLDRYAIDGDRAPRFHEAMAALVEARGESEPPARALVEHALSRAAGYGLVEPIDGVAAPALDPIDAAWRAALSDALVDQLGDATVRAWTHR